ncbi:hypothetical protein [Paenimyroides viscosum]|uniref:Uncharacterized protein n=1 Tax=Paenimyroides viscosum TaxID=2488729 RepID=A0A3P1B6L1_9FLAO|nr:hypothetical protein [Paenimyroides viscosum]RRA96675.1 hypothetical protein EG242_01150 [Paenimyroides viscosum]
MKYIIVLFLLVQVNVFAQENKLISQEANYQLKNEQLVYQLKMKNGKQLSVCIDKNENYIVYRYGSKNKIELEYPKEKNLSSFDMFEYSEYKRWRYSKFSNGINLFSFY